MPFFVKSMLHDQRLFRIWTGGYRQYLCLNTPAVEISPDGLRMCSTITAWHRMFERLSIGFASVIWTVSVNRQLRSSLNEIFLFPTWPFNLVAFEAMVQGCL